MSVMWSPLESKDGPGRHSGKDGTDNRSTSADTSLSRMCLDDATTTDDKQNGDVLRMQSVPKTGLHSLTTESRVSPSAHSCSAAQPMAEQVMAMDSDSVGSEESFTMLSVPATGTTILTGTAAASFVFWHHGSGSSTGDRSNVSRQTADDQCEQGSSDFARRNAESLNSTGVLQSVRV